MIKSRKIYKARKNKLGNMLRNKYFRENEEKNMDEVELTVEKLLKDPINSQPHNFVSIFNAERKPEVNHQVLRVPGQYDGLTTQREHITDERYKYSHIVEFIKPDGDEITKECVANIEFDMNPMSDEQLFDYNLSIITKFKRTVINLHIVNKMPDKLEEVIEVSSHPLIKIYRVFDEEKQWKVLSRLVEKNRNNKEITAFDYMEFAHCIANADKTTGKEYIEECVNFFTTINKINMEDRLYLHLTLKVMIKSIFEEDMEKTKELIMMITKAIPYEKMQVVRSYEEIVQQSEQRQQHITELKKELTQKEDEIQKLKAENEKLKNQSK